MAGKSQIVLDYIRGLAPDTKISVRGLSGKLSVSEGTAYKAIKKAEELNLVKTVPKAGTFRLNDSGKSFAAGSYADILDKLNITILCGEENADCTIDDVMLCIDSPERTVSMLRQKSGNIVCIAGDRHDVQSAVVSHGAHLILSSGASCSPDLIKYASKKHVSISTSAKDASVLFRELSASAPDASKSSEPAGRDLMQPPIYIMEDDITTDWIRRYADVFALNSRYAIVDNDGKFVRTVNASQVLSSPFSQRLGMLMSDGSSCCIADEDISTRKLAEKMLAENTELAFLTDGDKITGYITSNDLLRYLLQKSDLSVDSSSPFTIKPEYVSENRSNVTFSIELRDKPHSWDYSASPVLLFVAAANYHMRSISKEAVSIENINYYKLKDLAHIEKCNILSRVINDSGSHCTIEEEIRDASSSYAKSTIIVSRSNR